MITPKQCWPDHDWMRRTAITETLELKARAEHRAKDFRDRLTANQRTRLYILIERLKLQYSAYLCPQDFEIASPAELTTEAEALGVRTT